MFLSFDLTWLVLGDKYLCIGYGSSESKLLQHFDGGTVQL